LDDIYAARLGSFDIVTTIRSAKPRVIPPTIWKGPETRLFTHLRACYRRAKQEPPQAFLAAIRNNDVAVVTAHVQSMLDSDIEMSERLRRCCGRFLKHRSHSSAPADQ